MNRGNPRLSGLTRTVASLSLVLWIAASSSFAPAAGEDNVDASPSRNPHLAIKCEVCHAGVPGARAPTSKKIVPGLTKVPVSSCRRCHPHVDDSHHPVMKKIERKIPARFPRGPAGEVICSSCHDVHLGAQGIKLLRGFQSGQYNVRMDLCLDCHAENYLPLNPHNSPDGAERCRVCHTSAGGDTRTETIREGLDRKCDFCHDVLGKDHPANLNLLKNLPRWLTVGRTGRLSCAACHDPHGTSDTMHFLRVSFLDYLERARSDNPHGKEDHYYCRVCHREVSVHGQEMKNNLLFGKDHIVLCYSCHGEMDPCHLVMIKMPPGKTAPDVLPLTSDGKITCSTCHDPTPAGGCNVGIRGVGPSEPVSALCLRCHDKAYLAGINPHVAMSVKTACRFCHAYMTDPDKAERFQIAFISNARVICLRCHRRDSHPMGKDIKDLVPRQRLSKPFRLDRNGKVTCTTCHLYHFDSWGISGESGQGKFLVAVEKAMICSLCHRFPENGREKPTGESDQIGRSIGKED